MHAQAQRNARPDVAKEAWRIDGGRAEAGGDGGLDNLGGVQAEPAWAEAWVGTVRAAETLTQVS